MNNMWLSALLGLLYFVTALHGLPLNTDTEVVTNEENELVYVFNIYAVRNVKTNAVAKMLSQQSLEKIPTTFEPIGSVLLADDDTEPFTLAEFADYLEDNGVIVDRMDNRTNPKVIEIKIDDNIGDYLNVEDIIKYLQNEGIIFTIKREGEYQVMQIEFDESIEDLADRAFTLEELADYLEDEGFTVESELLNDEVKTIKIKVRLLEDENEKKIEHSTVKNDDQVKEKKGEPSIVNAIERNDERKVENKNEYNEDRVIPLDFVTRSDSMNKIRKRRTTCPECKTGNLIKQFINNYSEVN